MKRLSIVLLVGCLLSCTACGSESTKTIVDYVEDTEINAGIENQVVENISEEELTTEEVIIEEQASVGVDESPFLIEDKGWVICNCSTESNKDFGIVLNDSFNIMSVKSISGTDIIANFTDNSELGDFVVSISLGAYTAEDYDDSLDFLEECDGWNLYIEDWADSYCFYKALYEFDNSSIDVSISADEFEVPDFAYDALKDVISNIEVTDDIDRVDEGMCILFTEDIDLLGDGTIIVPVRSDEFYYSLSSVSNTIYGSLQLINADITVTKANGFWKGSSEVTEYYSLVDSDVYTVTVDYLTKQGYSFEETKQTNNGVDFDVYAIRDGDDTEYMFLFNTVRNSMITIYSNTQHGMDTDFAIMAELILGNL